MTHMARPDPLFNGCCIFCCFHPLHLQKSGQNQYGFLFSKCISLKKWWGELLIWYISFSCAIFCPTIFSPNLGHPWSRFLGDHPEKEIGSTIGLVNVVHLITLFLNNHLRWFLNLYLRWSSRTLGSVCWAEGSSSNFKPSIWGIFVV